MPPKKSLGEKIKSKYRHIKVMGIIHIDRFKMKFQPPSNKPRGQQILDRLGIKYIFIKT